MLQIWEEGNSVTRPNQTDWENSIRHNIYIVHCRCTCGEWHEHVIPTAEVLAGHLDELYAYANEKAMQEANVVPVCVETISPDGVTLPPRYGIATSHTSESTNNMFEEARDKSWLICLDYMLGKTMERITTLREGVKKMDGVVEHVVALLSKRWDICGR